MGRWVAVLALCSTLIACGVPRPRALAEAVTQLDPTLTPQQAVLLGPPDRISGSGLITYEYRLQGGGTLRLGFPGHAPISYARVVGLDGAVRDVPVR